MKHGVKNGGIINLSSELLKKSILPLLFIILVGIIFAFFFCKIKMILSPVMSGIVLKGITLIFGISLTFWLQKILETVFSWYASVVAVRTKTQIDEKFIPLIKRVSIILLWIIAMIVVLNKFGININALIATLGVSSLAIALAAQDTIANIIAGFLIMIDIPFRIGDEIKLPSGERVKVLDIRIRRSLFLNLEDNAIIIVPNLELSKTKIVNFTYGKEVEEKGNSSIKQS